MKRKCNYCNEDIEIEKIQQFAAHVGNCKHNPSFHLKMKKYIDNGKIKRNKNRIKVSCTCKKCDKIYELELTKYKYETGQYRKYCSSKCSNSRKKEKILYKCIFCQKESKYGNTKSNKFCSNDCQGKYERQFISIPKFLEGKIHSRKILREILSEQRGYKCEICGIIEWNKNKIVLQVDHIDGNPGNDLPNNLRLLCPNCHSQTDSFGGKNLGNGRKSRGLSR